MDARIAVDQRLPAPTIGVLREQAQADREKEDGYAWREGEVKRVIEAWQHLKTWQVLKVEKEKALCFVKTCCSRATIAH